MSSTTMTPWRRIDSQGEPPLEVPVSVTECPTFYQRANPTYARSPEGLPARGHSVAGLSRPPLQGRESAQQGPHGCQVAKACHHHHEGGEVGNGPQQCRGHLSHGHAGRPERAGSDRGGLLELEEDAKGAFEDGHVDPQGEDVPEERGIGTTPKRDRATNPTSSSRVVERAATGAATGTAKAHAVMTDRGRSKQRP